jgi:hypothetical protein
MKREKMDKLRKKTFGELKRITRFKKPRTNNDRSTERKNNPDIRRN